MVGSTAASLIQIVGTAVVCFVALMVIVISICTAAARADEQSDAIMRREEALDQRAIYSEHNEDTPN